MSDRKAQRSNCRFKVQIATDGKPFLTVQLYQKDTIPMLKEAVIGFELLGGMRVQNANKLAEMLNEHILEMFVITEDSLNDNLAGGGA